MQLYKTIIREAEVKVEIEKSIFIGHIKPVESKEEADIYIKEIKRKYKDATHNVPAMVIGSKMQIQWASDDGEPQGTSGVPMLNMFVNQGVTNLVIVVTRYFGGIKLGTGGLVRAYTGCAQMALEAAIICSVEEMCLVDINLGYSEFSKLQTMATKTDKYIIHDISYLDDVRVTLKFVPESEDIVKQEISNLTKGSFEFINRRVEAVKNPL